MPAERLRELGISKVMTITSTYDHRVIQGAESGEFLRTLDGLLQGDAGILRGDLRQPGPQRAGGRRSGPRYVRAAGPGRPRRPSRRPPTGLAQVAAAMALVKAYPHPRPPRRPARSAGQRPARRSGARSRPRSASRPRSWRPFPPTVLRVAVPGGTLAEALPHLQATYCGTIAYEVEHISSHEERVWLRRDDRDPGAFRTPLSAGGAGALLDAADRGRGLRAVPPQGLPGQKRFSIEGVDMLVPMLDHTIERPAESGARDVVIGMAHRGRLNVLAHTVGRPYADHLRRVRGRPAASDGAPGRRHRRREVPPSAPRAPTTPAAGRRSRSPCSPNPSHLEFVAPVVDGRARAEQTQRRGREAHARPDARAAGRDPRRRRLRRPGRGRRDAQPRLRSTGYRTGGTLHLIANNQVGFTTDMNDARSTRYASDLAKGFDIPIIHVNADDAEACLARRPAGDGVPGTVPRGRPDRPGRLPPARPQRGRRAELYPAADVRADQGAADGARAVRRRRWWARAS